ncbi:trihelix transcription factor GT-2-like [Cicer arietinum]|uniref:Trihelix transcription factor GT-2-like n=1 Tax=Cicer arietinum TaxID=3827 RepID=A0A1S2XYC3_CICAR|nr:trihelix transcription factor GT-2-like [Cicer arietinum]
MELGDATVMDSSSGEIVAPEVHDGGDEKGRNGGEEDDKMMNITGSGGNRWPRQETLALLKIRSDMDGVFRDSSLKGPLWEEVSRKLAELGYHRNAKKCKEKFENVYKYHKRTKEGKSGKKSEGKTYRFFDQLQALEKQFSLSSYPPTSKPQPNNNIVSLPTKPNNTTTISHVPSTNPTTLISPSPPPPLPPPTNATTTPTLTNNKNNNNVQYSLPNMNLFSTTTTSTSSSTASDEDLEEKYRKKRKWKDYFRRLTREVLIKQEEMQKKFLEAIDKREREHMAQQDAWRVQEMNRINKEHELLVQERSTTAAKNAAVIAFLQKLSGQQNSTIQDNFIQPPPPPQPTPPESAQTPISQLQIQPHEPVTSNNNIVEIHQNNGHKSGGGASSRWPKSEVHALIRIRTSLEPKYQENGPKAPLWEDISAGMQRLGYNRNSKRCKEKWENINKYYKKMKESNKQRRDGSKTCPYFNELEALYKEKNKTFHNNIIKSSEMMEPLMVQPEQQWRPPTTITTTQYDEEEKKKKNSNEVEAKEEDYDDNDDDEYDEGDSMEEEEEDEGGVNSRYEVMTNKLSPVDTVE